MKKINFKKYKFHCSSLPKLMVEGRSKNGDLSETTKAYLREIWIKEMYGRDRSYQTVNKYTQKGTMVETDSLELYEKATGKTYFKNNEQLENRYVVGTPDVKKPLIDIKSSWDIWTFAAVTEASARKDYYWQVAGYSWLTGRKVGKLVFALTNTPEAMVNDELYRLSFKIGEEETEKYRVNFTFDDIDAKKRIKQYRMIFEKSDIESLKIKIEECRKYLSTIKL